MSPILVHENKTSIPLTKNFRQLLNMCISGGKFIVIHPHYQLIREAMRLDIIGEEQLEELELLVAQHEAEEAISFEQEDLFFLYALTEINCRLFICEIGDDLKKLAIECGDTNETEFIEVRAFFLHQAEEFLHSMNETFHTNEEFEGLLKRIDQLNELA
jgi:hypothetical protein